ncbi:hypothetical protein BcDW1_9960 [Botrytis cinerea BcDW1]|uniref:Uncharacterized protein n=1 Tax=Botryotinia fuckeliana (strain BcDW1) TaxID=1290391 RepID=M7TJA9_BOTF1|nr:hypothetical protein BcDW1_9960 [Botrytis cinerea BcDW1]
MNKRHNQNGNQKKSGNANKDDAKLAHTLERPANEITVKDNPIDLIQRLQACFQSQETDSNAMRSEIQHLKDTLKDTLEQSQADISGLSLVIKTLESSLQNLLEELQTKAQAMTELENQHGDEVLEYETGIKASKKETEKLQAKVKELNSVIQAAGITAEVLKLEFEKERSACRTELESIKAKILELQQKNMSKDIEAKSEPANIDKSIPSASKDKVDADCGTCVLQSVQINNMKVDLAVLSRSLYQNSIGILSGVQYMTHNSGIATVEPTFTPMQIERREDWLNSLHQMVEGRISSQNNGSPDYTIYVKRWQSSYSYLENLEISQVLFCQCAMLNSFLSKERADITNLRNVLSAQKIETINCQEKLIASHGKVIDGLKEEAKIKRTEEEIKQKKLRDTQQEAIDSLKTNYEARLIELEKEHSPYRDIAERILAREFEWCKPPRERNEEIIYQGNLAAHGGNCRAVLRRTELSPSDEDEEWFKHWYGVSLKTFAEHKDSPKMQKLLDMRYEMKKFKTVQLSDTAFDRYFQAILCVEIEECESPTSSQSHIDEQKDIEIILDSVFSSMCSEYNEAAENEKRRRKSDWKLGHTGQNMGDSIVENPSNKLSG